MSSFNSAMKVRRIENKLGIKGSPTCELVFTNTPAKMVGEPKMGLIKYVMSLMNGARLGVGAQSVGVAQAAYEEALAYAKDRTQFGKAIIEFPAVFEMLAIMPVIRISSPSLQKVSPNEVAIRLIASVVPRVKIISRDAAALINRCTV